VKALYELFGQKSGKVTFMGSHCRVVDIATRLRGGRARVGIPAGARYFSVLPNFQKACGGLLSLG
jgi:hypothetical protein